MTTHIYATLALANAETAGWGDFESGRMVLVSDEYEWYVWTGSMLIKIPSPHEPTYTPPPVRAVKAELEKIAAAEGLTLPEYLRKHYYELVTASKETTETPKEQKSRAQLMLEELEK